MAFGRHQRKKNKLNLHTRITKKKDTQTKKKTKTNFNLDNSKKNENVNKQGKHRKIHFYLQVKNFTILLNKKKLQNKQIYVCCTCK